MEAGWQANLPSLTRKENEEMQSSDDAEQTGEPPVPSPLPSDTHAIDEEAEIRAMCAAYEEWNRVREDAESAINGTDYSDGAQLPSGCFW